MPQALPANPDLDWLKKSAKRRLAELRARSPDAKLHQAQLAVARDHGFASWRALKAHIDDLNGVSGERERVLAAVRKGDVEAVRRAFESGFDPATPDRDGRTAYQIARELGHADIELLTQRIRGGRLYPDAVQDKVQAIMTAAQSGDVETLAERLDANPELIDALGGRGMEKATPLSLAALRNQHGAACLLIARGADVNKRDFPDNAGPLHFAAAHADIEMVRLLVEAGADVDGLGDDHAVGVLGWATCFRQVRVDVAAYLLGRGASLNVWTAIALDRPDALRALVAQNPALLTARMSRNEHRRTPLHHAAARSRIRMVRLLLELGADPNATDATGATPLTTAAGEHAEAAISAALAAAGSRRDLLTAINSGRFDEAEAMLRENPQRIGPDGPDTIALHLAISKDNRAALRWLLAHGVAVDAKRMMWDCNHTALHMAVERGAMDVALLLLDSGANPNIRDDKFNATALGWAEHFGRKDFAELIRAKGGVP